MVSTWPADVWDAGVSTGSQTRLGERSASVLSLTCLIGLRVLKKLRAKREDPDANSAQIEYLQVKQQVELEAEEGSQSLIYMLKKPSIRKRMLCGFLLLFLSQSTGVLVVFNYQVCSSPRMYPLQSQKPEMADW